MMLSRRALNNEVRTLTAQLDAERASSIAMARRVADAEAVAHELRRRVRDLEVSARQAGPALADNIRLAHRCEVAETMAEQSAGMLADVLAQFEALTARFPHLFNDQGQAS